MNTENDCVKGIVGEAEVIGKLEKNPKDLWNLTFQDSGIKVELFYKYFENYSRACAYKLGTVTRYANIIPLHNIGIEAIYNKRTVWRTYVYDLL